MQQKIDPQRIRTDLGTQARVQTDASVVEEYATAMRRGDQFPPIRVFHDLDPDELILVDGFHRLAAHLKTKPDEEIDVIIQEGTLSDARWTSFTVNATHGLRRSTADKRRIIIEALRHEKGGTMSDRQIAEHVGVDKNTVASVRRELEAGGEIHHVHCREGKDGKAYAVKTAKAEPTKPVEPDGKALIALPKFPGGQPEMLGKILVEFFDEDYLCGLMTNIKDRIMSGRRKHADSSLFVPTGNTAFRLSGRNAADSFMSIRWSSFRQSGGTAAIERTAHCAFLTLHFALCTLSITSCTPPVVWGDSCLALTVPSALP